MLKDILKTDANNKYIKQIDKTDLDRLVESLMKGER